METAICNSNEDIQDRTVVLDPAKSDLNSSENCSFTGISFQKNQNSNIEKPIEADQYLETYTAPESLESLKQSEFLDERTLSTSMIEQAYNVMKYLFSPEKKTKKSANTFSPVQPKPSGSPCNNISNSVTKTLETANDISSVAHSATLENNSKCEVTDMNQLGVLQSPLNFDIHNSTDDSYLTTVSLIDESFQSAVTHLDENAETVKESTSTQDNTFDNSALDSLDLCNDNENSIYGLENTMLCNGSFLSEGTKIGDISTESKEENLESLGATHVINYCENTENMKKEKITPHIIVNGISNEAVSNRNILDGDGSDKDKELLSKLLKNMNINSPKSSNSFEQILERSEKNGEGNFYDPLEWKTIKSESDSVVEWDENDGQVQESVSTSTIVLSAVESSELDNLLLSLKTEGSETNSSSLTSLEGEEVASMLLVNSQATTKALPLSKGSEHNLDLKPNNFSVCNVEKKSSKSEGNSPTEWNPKNKNKLNKSMDHILHRSFSESPKLEKRLLNKQMGQPFVDMSMVNYGERNFSELKAYEMLEQKTSLNSCAFDPDAQMNNSGNYHELNISDSQITYISKEKELSQNSYTILDCSSISKPIINSPEELDFKTKSNNTFSENFEKGEDENIFCKKPNLASTPQQLVSSSTKYNENVLSDLSGNENVKSLEQIPPYDKILKQEEPIIDNNDIVKVKNTNKPEKNSGMNEELTHFSPITPVSDNPFHFPNSAEKQNNNLVQEISNLNSTIVLPANQLNEENQGLRGKSLSPIYSHNNETFIKNPESFLDEKHYECWNKNVVSVPATLNKTYDKNSDSSQQNKTFEKKAETLQCENRFTSSEKQIQLSSKKPVNDLNQIFEKNAEPLSSRKLNETFDKKSLSPPLLNKTFDKKLHSSSPKILNKTYDKKPELPSDTSNQTFEKKQKSPTPNDLNETFVKKFTSPPKVLNKASEKNTESSATFVREIEKNPELFPSQTLVHNKKSPTLDKTNEAQNVTFNKDIDKFSESSIMNEMNQSFEKLSLQAVSQIEKTNEQGVVESFRTHVITEKEPKESFLINPGIKLSNLTQSNDIVNCKIEVTDVDLLNQEIDSRENNMSPPEASVFFKNNDFPTEPSEFSSIPDLNGSFVSSTSSNTSLLGTSNSTVLHQGECLANQIIDDLVDQKREININENSIPDLKMLSNSFVSEHETKEIIKEQMIFTENEKLQCDPDLVQLIREQFSSTDIEKICSVVDGIASKNLSNQIPNTDESLVKFNNQNFNSANSKLPENSLQKSEKFIDALSPHSFDFLNSIGGKIKGRDLSRESLYVKFDPLVQPPNANSLIDFTKEVEAVQASDGLSQHNISSDVCERLLAISPEKRPDDIVPPLTPLSQRNKNTIKEDSIERLKELQNEIYFLKNLYSEREKTNKAKMDDYENQIAKLTGQSCLLEDKLKESSEREKSLVKKLKEQTQSMNQLKIIMEEYSKVISKLTAQLEAMKNENLKQIENLTSEKESYVTHLQNTEAAFADVHTKYEKSKKTIASLKANEVMYRNTIADQYQKLEDFKERAKEAQERAFKEFQRVQEELNNRRTSQAQETTRLKAQLRKTELKLEALQESLDQKIKENEQLTAICDELIEGKK